VNGIINVHKPSGYTSFDIVAKIKRISGEKRVGHAGTLDPMASGVLPVCLGQATRIVEYLMDATKTYRAEIELGVVTDTYDVEGQVIRRSDSSGIAIQQVEDLLASFQGTNQQTPPPYSAVKYQGKPLYHWARTGVMVEKQSRPVEIHELKILAWQPPVVTVEVTCGKGTYIRSLAYDLGEKLGCGASLKSLVRTRYGAFNLEDAVTITQVEAAFHSNNPDILLNPIDCILVRWPKVVASEANAKKIINGDYIDVGKETPPTGEYCRAYSPEGSFFAVLHYDTEAGLWHPDKVFRNKP